MVSIPGGTFNMGWKRGEWDEQWVHEVKLDAFLISATEITQNQYREVMDQNPSHFKETNYHGYYPVEQVNWYEAVKFCNRLSEFANFQKCYNEEKLGM